MISIGLLIVARGVYMYLYLSIHFLMSLVILEYLIVGLYISLIILISTLHSDIAFIIAYLYTRVSTNGESHL